MPVPLKHHRLVRWPRSGGRGFRTPCPGSCAIFRFLATFGDQVPAVWPQSPCRLTSWFRFTAASPKVAKSPFFARQILVPVPVPFDGVPVHGDRFPSLLTGSHNLLNTGLPPAVPVRQDPEGGFMPKELTHIRFADALVDDLDQAGRKHLLSMLRRHRPTLHFGSIAA